MKNILITLLILASLQSTAQTIVCDNKDIEQAMQLALQNVDQNTRAGILAAGADYGGEWVRDISINSWNGVSLLRPKVAEQSLWGVTINKDSVGHQYWDKIIWVIAAYNHYKVNGDKKFLEQAYNCSANTMKQLEEQVFNKTYKLFTGPSVFNDGIAGYPEPVFDPTNKSSFVLDHKGADKIMCLSTNAVYYGAYLTLLKMQQALNKKDVGYTAKAAALKSSIRKYFYNPEKQTFNYLIDQNGKIDHSQEALGWSYAILFGIVDDKEAHEVVKHAVVSKYGITSVYPNFKRYSDDSLGRHNKLVWPMVNGFFAAAALKANSQSTFTKEFLSLTHLALDADKGNRDFKEIYNPFTGAPDGGFQGNGNIMNNHWPSCKVQTWSATAYISMLLNGVVGLKFKDQSFSFTPFLPESIHHVAVTNLVYRDAVLNIDIKGSGSTIKSFIVDGKQQTTYVIDSKLKGVHSIAIELN